MKSGYVYILASRRNGTLYIGVTGDLERRISEHQNGVIHGFTKQHGVKYLVYCEEFSAIDQALAREKAIKKWRRVWKLELIESNNPNWLDLMTGFPLSRE
ncbi:excinuclease ABC subunit C [Terasakiella brassicae]|uniref:Excinuclease ABC subunit C n=1 Tax=Terasakiella brassicae TaxID=1634917 RepID=A0A917FEM0_9PROT|nr:GIY-YIG nuclease family protein [Terasakiella brassicae]GGF73944.1 excinuclease ABC subunit C [Terasakiella brassicae]